MFGPITFPSPISVLPCRYVFGQMTVSRPIVTPISMYVEAGSINVTPFNMCDSLTRRRISASTSDRWHACVDADRLLRILHDFGLHRQPSLDRHFDRVRQIILALVRILFDAATTRPTASRR